MSRPLISVVIPSYNRCDTLMRVLAAYEAQRPEPLNFEVVVVDDGSADPTVERLAGWRPRRYGLRFARQANAGPAAARNRGVALAQGDWVLFTGDDIEPTPELLAEHWRGHQLRPDSGTVILGHTCWPPGARLTATMRHIDGVGAQQFSYHYLKDGAEYDFRHFYTSNVSVARRLLQSETEGFSTDFPAAAFEDAEFAYRLSRRGARIFYRAAAVAHHHHYYTARKFFRRQERCGEMAAVLYRKWPQLEKWVGVDELTAIRLATLAAGPEVRGPVERLSAELAAWERRLLNLAAFFDPLEAAAADPLLLALFRYAYQRGLVRAVWPEEVGRRTLAALFLRDLPPLVEGLERDMEGCRVPCPRADTAALASLARFRRPAK